MNAEHVIATDLARVYSSKDRKGFLRMLGWGDYVEVRSVGDDYVEITTVEYKEYPDGSIKPLETSAFIVPTRSSGLRAAEVVRPRDDNEVLKVNFVDVQQGDGTVIETPKGKVLLIDGGDNQLFARYLAARYRDTSEQEPKEIDCIVVTHGDADHFEGLTRIYKSEDESFEGWEAYKRLFIHPKRVYHNGLVKRPSKVPERDRLGSTESVDGQTIITGLEEDLLRVPDDQMNTPFRKWKEALTAYNGRGAIEFRRLEKGNHEAFDFLRHEDIHVEVLGPMITESGGVRGLRFLGDPPKGPRIGQDQPRRSTSISASHTINGHSIVLRLTYGGFHFLLTGDLNEESERDLLNDQAQGAVNLRAEVLKVPHHGSADFYPSFIAAVSPVISVVSSGDESARKEYIHPRATLMGALGKHSRVDEPLIFVTELVAFFEARGFIDPETHLMRRGKAVVEDGEAVIDSRAEKSFYAFSRAAYGLVRIRTDGQRLLVYTDSGQADLKEAYAFALDATGEPIPTDVKIV